MTSFPFRLRGRGIFSQGGDGLWRQNDALEQASAGMIQKRGIMFLGNDFGTLTSYMKLQSKSFENPPTWRHLKARITTGGVPPEMIFATNAVLGLRAEGKALDKKDWGSMLRFGDFCREFLQFQIKVTQPRLIVILGQAADTLRILIPGCPQTSDGVVREAMIDGHACLIRYTSHPYADFALDATRRQRIAGELRAAWAACGQNHNC